MRIVAGRWRGRSLSSPAGRVRPTAESVRDAWMAAVVPAFEGAPVLDLFAGSGALGLEALSRGASSVDFVENGGAALHALKANVAALRATSNVRIFKKDVFQFLETVGEMRYSVALADPPYGSTVLDRLISIWRERPFSAVLSVEHDSAHRIPEGERTLRFGETSVTVYRVDAARGAGRPNRRPAADGATSERGGRTNGGGRMKARAGAE